MDHFEHPEPPSHHHATVHNWRLLSLAFKTATACIVRCNAPDGNVYNVLCKVVQMPHPKHSSSTCYYIPLGLMISRDLMPLMNSLAPPDTLQCGWSWPPDGSDPSPTP